jgi:general secretion pathway protein K
MTCQRCAAEADSEQGFVIVAVLWIVAALSALAVIFAAYLSNSAQALAVSDNGLKTDVVVSAGVELAAYQLALAGDSARPLQGGFRLRLDNADLSVSFVSEAARVDLNLAPKQLLASLLAGLGADREQADQYADRIVGWRTPPKAGAAEDEVSLYRAAGFAYAPRQAPFAHVNELALVVGLPPALVERALPFVTVFSGLPQINVRVAAPEVIAALPGMTPLVLKSFWQEQRSLPDDMAAVATALGPAKASATTEKSDAYRIQTTVKFDNGHRASSVVVIGLGGEEEPYRVLSWQDDVWADAGRSRRLTGDRDDR